MESMRRVIVFAFAVPLLVAACSAPATETTPNVVVILADDQGWGDLSVHGNTNLSTPHLDSLARDGALFERFYVSSVCSPTRAEFLTGRYYPRGGVSGTSAGAERLNLDERTIADTFKAGGYVTAAFGKWHNGTQGPYHPRDRGFDEFYGFTSGHWATYFDPPLDHNRELVTGKGFLADDLTDRALTFIEAHRERPFFVYLPYNTPHSPMQVPDEFWVRWRDKDLAMRHREPDLEDVDHTRAALAMVENIDGNVGRVLGSLARLGLARNTIVVYFSDNGPNGWRWNGDMKGRKGSLDEGGLRSPLLVRWPGRIAAGTRVPHIAAAVDLLPTLADLAGLPIVGDKPLDGRSLEPLLLGSSAGWPDRRIFSFGGRAATVSVRTERYRLDAVGQLFDLVADPGQRTDIAGRHPDLAAELRAAAERVAEDVRSGYTSDPRPFTVGHARRTWLPARDAVGAGSVERSNRFPNSSYFTRWTGPGAVVTWDIAVLEAGDYEATAYYACPARDVGATVRLTFLGASTTARIAEAHDPPLIGAEHDRIARVESYTKNFRPMAMGTLRLAQQRGKLALTAPEIPGSQAWEVSGVMLTRR